MFSLFCFIIIISGLFAVTSLSVCTAWFHNTVTSPSSHTGLGMCVYHLSVVSIPKALHIEQCKWVQTLSCLIKYSFFAKIGHPEVYYYYYYYYYYLQSFGSRNLLNIETSCTCLFQDTCPIQRLLSGHVLRFPVCSLQVISGHGRQCADIRFLPDIYWYQRRWVLPRLLDSSGHGGEVPCRNWTVLQRRDSKLIRTSSCVS